MAETLEDFVARIVRDRPATIDSVEMTRVKPEPWVTRHGYGSRARIRMHIGGEVKYERRPEDKVWHRVEHWTMGAAL